MIKKINFQKGFTLIELMVVVAIIALIASVIVANLRTARAKSRDSFLREQAHQMRILLEQEYNETGSYAGLQPSLWVPGTACSALVFSGNFAAKAREICNAVVAQGYNLSGSPGMLFLGNGSDPTNKNKYSILIALPGKNTYYCLGSSGQNSDTTDMTGDGSSWLKPGCYFNP